MPRRAQGPRLYLDPRRKQWVIRDGTHFIRTGRAEGEREQAERALADYLAAKFRPKPSPSPGVAEVLLAYQADYAPHTNSAATIRHTISNLERWWGDMRVSDVNARNCRAYAATRPPVAGRRDLETLRAALRYWNTEYAPLNPLPAVTLPEKPEARDRWLTRSEAARLLWAARRTPHLARFILIGLYTGTRSGAILALTWNMVDLNGGVMRRRPTGEIETNKRRPRVRLGSRLLAHLRRWKRLDGKAARVVHYNGKPVTKLRRSWETARKRAGLDDDVTPHTLRHTRATWLMQAGVSPWQAAGALGMSTRTLEIVYGHHHPDFQKDAAEV